MIIRSLINELKERIGELRCVPDTLYIGGGTPSLIPSDLFRCLCSEIRKIIGKHDDWIEFTIEVNPEDVNHLSCGVWKECGVNRISMGVQTFNDSELKTIGRRHDSAKAIDAYDILRSYFDNINIDLMFGLPGQTMHSWSESVKTTLHLRPEHISAYSLMFEPYTPITVLRDKGRLVFPSETESLGMWEHLTESFGDAGYSRYEISNYSLPGFESVHNRGYWLGTPYLGIGPSAHSYDGENIRRGNPPKIREYVDRFFCNGSHDIKEDVFYDEESLSEEQLMEEKIMLRLRMMEGIDMMEFSRLFGKDATRRVIRNARRFVDRGELEINDNRIYLSKRGIMISDDIILALCM